MGSGDVMWHGAEGGVGAREGVKGYKKVYNAYAQRSGKGCGKRRVETQEPRPSSVGWGRAAYQSNTDQEFCYKSAKQCNSLNETATP